MPVFGSPPQGTAADSSVIIRLREVTKKFPGVVANDSISLDIKRGEVHCLLGENGAGKSTLIDILAGFQQPDAGSIEVNGVRTAITSPAVSIANGIGVVYQHTALIPTLTVLENLMLGNERRFWLSKSKAIARLAELGELLGVTVDPHMLAGDLALGQQQQVEIAKAMWVGSGVLLLDEPTSMLTPQAIDTLVQSLNRLKAEGVAIVFITHKLHEAYAIGDTVTVLRAGRVAGRIRSEELHSLVEDQAKSQIVNAMFGPISELRPDAPGDSVKAVAVKASLGEVRPVAAPDEASLLKVEGASTTSDAGETPLLDVDLQIGAGEILGVAGIDGHGQSHLAEVVAGQRMPSAGRLVLDGVDITKRHVKARQRLGVRYVTDDRLNEGVVGSLSVAINLVLKFIGERPFWRAGRMNRAAVEAEAERQIADFEIGTPSSHTPAGTLSGGNIQKLLLARELAHDPRIVIFHKPTHGLDQRTVERVRETVRNFASEGGAALLISTDLDEIAELADRIVVISNGRIVGEVVNDGDRVTERIGEIMAGEIMAGEIMTGEMGSTP